MSAVSPRRAVATSAVVLGVLAAMLGAGLPASAADPTPSSSASPSPSGTASPSGSPTSTPAATSSRAKKSGAKRPTPTPTVPAKARKGAIDGSGDATDRAAARRKKAADAKVRAAAAAKAAAEAKLQADEDAHDAAALVAASAQLMKAQADLAVARSALTTAQSELALAQQADQAAQAELEASVLAEQRATRDLAAVETRIAVRERDLGRLANAAYQSNGAMGEWAIALSSTTPNQLADRLAFLQSVGSAGNAVLARLREDRADLLNARSTLTASRRRQEDARAGAATTLVTVSTKAMMARAAQQQVNSVVAARKAAFEQAKKAAVEDKRQYGVMVAYSGALATRIVDLAAKLAKGHHAPQGTGQMVRPGLGVVTSSFGPRFHPILHYVKVHTGIDFAAADGIVYAADDGVVLLTEYNVAYGNMTVVDHGTIGGVHMTTLYAHQAAIGVKPGDRVVKGQAIGVIGSTGYATGPHLHFEVRIDGQPLDPAPFLEKAPLPTSLPATVPDDVSRN
jgi:murein DD-endopeptidase MepM/ murein hydrolase activator NlpD